MGTHFTEPVFSMEQGWAGPHYGWHGIVENFLRAAPFIEELKASKMKIIVLTPYPSPSNFCLISDFLLLRPLQQEGSMIRFGEWWGYPWNKCPEPWGLIPQICSTYPIFLVAASIL
jgi:hypothetical protein